MSEYSEQCALFDWAKMLEDKEPRLRLLFHVPNGEFRHPRTALKLKLMGVKAGVLDNFLPCQNDEGFCGLWVELKFGKNKMTDSQIDFADNAVKNGYAVTVAYNWQDAAFDICSYLNLSLSEFGIDKYARGQVAYPIYERGKYYQKRGLSFRHEPPRPGQNKRA